MKNLIFIAPPAAGKGTISEILKQKYHIPHISTGDLLRNAVLKGDNLAKKIQQLQEAGALVDDTIVLDLLKSRILEEDCKNGYILDGFPRTIEQAQKYCELLKQLGKDLGVVISLEVDFEVAAKRILGRRSCPNCGAVYNTYFVKMKPKEEGICDICQSALTSRTDDNIDTFRKRWETYMESTKPLLAYYANLGVLFTVDSMDTSAAVREIEEILK